MRKELKDSVTMTIESNAVHNVCITTNQPDTKCNPIPCHNYATKQRAIVNNQLNIVTCRTYRGGATAVKVGAGRTRNRILQFSLLQLKLQL